ncbi:MAG: hypothetical protein MI725_02975, partial [Pirellulales bacterium]|nr:hypothetical protein [Pirellulales bacterium]
WDAVELLLELGADINWGEGGEPTPLCTAVFAQDLEIAAKLIDQGAHVNATYVNLRGQQAADDLMEMVRGFNPQEIGQSQEELQQGALVKLLGWLDSDSLDYRVLAIYNLNKITGTSYLAGYRPDSDSTQRKRALRKLWDRFEANELLLAEP